MEDITEEQRVRYQKLAGAFNELYEQADVMVLDAAKFKFVRLQWFNKDENFDFAMI